MDFAPRACGDESIRIRTYASLKSSWLIATIATFVVDSTPCSSAHDAVFVGSTMPTVSVRSRSSSGSSRCCQISFAGTVATSCGGGSYDDTRTKRMKSESGGIVVVDFRREPGTGAGAAASAATTFAARRRATANENAGTFAASCATTSLPRRNMMASSRAITSCGCEVPRNAPISPNGSPTETSSIVIVAPVALSVFRTAARPW